MRTRTLLTVLAALGVLVYLGLLSQQPVKAASASVSIVDFAFQPASVAVNVGETVTWTNNGNENHSSVGDWTTGTIAPGESVTITFNAVGTYSYVCGFHNGMTGSVVVSTPDPATDTPTETTTGTTTSTPTETTTGTTTSTPTETTTGVATSTPTSTAMGGATSTPTATTGTAPTATRTVVPSPSPTPLSGLGWRPLGPPTEGSPGINELAISAGTPATIFASTSQGELWRSFVGSGRWTLLTNGLPNGIVRSLATHPTANGTVFAAIDNEIYRSTDGGNTWSKMGSITLDTIHALVIDPKTPTTMLAVTREGLFRSTDSGTTWTSVFLGGFIGTAFNPSTPATVYANTSNGMLRSSDNGVTWKDINNGLPTNRTVRAIAIDPTRPTTIFIATESGLFRSTDGGDTWSVVNIGVTARAVGLTAVDVYAVQINPVNPKTLCIGLDSGNVLRSIDGGVTWSSITFGIQDNPIYELMFSKGDPSTLYAATGDGVFAFSTKVYLPFISR